MPKPKASYKYKLYGYLTTNQKSVFVNAWRKPSRKVCVKKGVACQMVKPMAILMKEPKRYRTTVVPNIIPSISRKSLEKPFPDITEL